MNRRKSWGWWLAILPASPTKADGRGFLPQERLHLWLIDAQTGEAHPLTDGETYDETDPIWSPDGQTLVFCSNRSADPDFQPEAVDLFTIPLTAEPGDESTWRKIETPVGEKSLPSFSPDGQWLAYLGMEGRGDWWKHTHLWVVPFDGSRPARDLTKNFDRHLDQATIGRSRQRRYPAARLVTRRADDLFSDFAPWPNNAQPYLARCSDARFADGYRR